MCTHFENVKIVPAVTDMSNILLNTIKSSGSQLQILEPVTAPSIVITQTENALNLSSGALQVAGGMSVVKDIFTNASVVTDTIKTSSGVGGDTRSLTLSSFGSTSLTSGRGAVIQLDGVDSLSSGKLSMVGVSGVSILTGTGVPVERIIIDNTGATTVSGAVTLGSTLLVTNNATLSGSLTVTGGVVVAPTFTTSASGTSTFDKIEVQNTTDTSGTSTGALVVAGGVGIAKGLTVGTFLGGLSGGITVTSTTDSNALGTGSIVTSGGISVAKNMYINGLIRSSSTIDSTTPLTGGVTLAGGLGIAKSLSMGGPLRTLSGESTHWEMALANGTPKWQIDLESTTFAFRLLGVSSGLGLTINETSGNITVNSTHASSSISTLGGITIAKNATINGITIVTSTDDTVDLSTGALQVAGGSAISKTLRVGEMIDVIGNNAKLGDLEIRSSVDISSTPLYGSNRATFLHSGFQRATDSFTPLVISKWNSNVPIVGITDASVYIQATTVATSTTTGALQVTGGISTGGASFLSGVSLATLTVRGSSINISSNKTFVSDTTGVLSLNPSGHFGSLDLGSQNTTLGGTANMTIVGGSLLFGNVHQMTSSGEWLYNFNGTTVQNALVGTAKVSLSGSIIEFFTGATNTAPTNRHLSLNHSSGIILHTPVESQGVLVVTSTVNSFSTTTGALRLSGGLAVAKNMYVGGVFNCSSQVDITGTTTVYGQVVVSNATDSTSTSTGSIVTTGGIGVKLNASIGGDLLVSGSQTFTGDTTFGGQLLFLDTTDTTVLGEGSLVLSGGLSVAKGLVIGSASAFGGSMSISGQVTISNNTTTSSSNSGAFVVTGGVGIGEKLFVQNNISTAGNLSVSGNSSIIGSITLGNGTLVLSNALDIFHIKSSTPGMSLSATGIVANTVYSNLFTMFSLGSSLLDVNYEALQTSTLGTDGFTILTRASGTGNVRKLVLQTGTNTGQLILHTNGAIELPIALSITSNVNPSKSNSTSTALTVPNGSLLLGESIMFASDSPNGATPTTTTRSSGSRIVLYPNITGSTTDTSIGIDSSQNLWMSTQSALRAFSATTEILHVSRGAVKVATSIEVGSISGSASGGTSLKLYSALAESIQVAPLDGNGGPVSIQFASDNTMTQNGTTGSLWSLGRNLNSSGLTTMALTMSGPSGETTVQYWDNSGNLYLNSTTQASTGQVGALVVSGGANITKDLIVGGSLSVTGTINGAFTGTSLTLSDTTQSTSTTTGTLIVSGGTSIAKNLYVGGNAVLTSGNLVITSGNISVTGTTTLSGKVIVQNTEDSVDLTTGSLVTSGGLAVTKTLYANGAIIAAGQIIQLGDAFITNDTVNGLYLIPPNASAGIKIRNASNTASLVTITDSGPMSISTTLSVTATGNSTTALTGAMTIAGGVGIFKDVNIGGTLNVSTGAIITGSSLLDKVLQISSAADIPIARAIEITYPNLSTANTTTIGIGKNTSFKNMGVIGFKYSDDQNNNNLMTLGVSGTEGIVGVWANGSVSIGSISSIPTSTLSVVGSTLISGILQVSDTTQSTSTTTGALAVSGGLAVAKNIHVGGSLDVSSSCIFRSNVQLSSIVNITDTTETNTIGQGSLVVSGGVSIAKTTYIGTELHVIGGTYVADLYLTGSINTSSTTQSNNITSGSIVTAGGLAVGKNMYLGGNLTMISSAGTLTTSYLTVTDNTPSTSPSTGSVKITGGVGIQGNLYAGGVVNLKNTTPSTSFTTGALLIDGGIGLSGNLYSNGTIVATGAITSTSDERLKTNIHDLPTGALNAINNIKTVSYEFKGSPAPDVTEPPSSDMVYGPFHKNQYMGVLAQQLEEVIPSVVFTSRDVNNTRSVDYARLTVVLIKAVQELTAEIEHLKKQSREYQ